MSRSLARVTPIGVLMCLISAVTFAQTTTTTLTENKKFEVISVDGNTLVVTLPEGTREISVPDDFRFIVNGQPMSVHELKPGMAGMATITTRTKSTPVTVTEVKDGEVVLASGSSIHVRTPDGQIRAFTQSDVDKRGVKIVRDGKPAKVSDFRPGDRLTATIITTTAPRIVTDREVQATIAAAKKPAAAATPAPAAAPAPPPSAPPAAAAQAPRAPAAEPAPQEARALPKTAGSQPLIALLGLSSLLLGATLTLRRRRTR
jgi:LPXTG-motif cell wall-anchored protein